MFVQISRTRRFFATLVVGISLYCIWSLVTDQSITGGKLSEVPTPVVVTETVTRVMWVESPPQCADSSQGGSREQCKQADAIINWTSSR